MSLPIAPDYRQQLLLPRTVEDWVAADHPARFLREFVDQLDLAGLSFVMPSAIEGRPCYAPSLLLKIWLYGYFHRIRSSRKLEVACREQMGLIWLSGQLQPDHNTLWRFWRDNKGALRELFKQTVKLAVKTGAVGLVLQAVDGTKIEAACSGYSGWNKEFMEKLLPQLDEILDQTEHSIGEESHEEGGGYRLPPELAEVVALRGKIKAGLAQLEADGREHYHPGEPEARRMKVGSSTRFAYNAQAVADAKEGVIVACDVSRQETDSGQLMPMVQQARQNLQTTESDPTTVADTGYGAGADLLKAKADGLPVLVYPAAGAPSHGNAFAAQQFHYDAAAQTVSCPKGERLDYEGHTTENEVRVERYRCHHRDCPWRSHCTRDPKGRQFEVWPHTEAVQEMRQRLEQPQAQAQLRRRGVIIEPRFGQIKQHEGFRRWTVRGWQSVRAQWALLCSTLNLRVLYRHWRKQLAETLMPLAC